MKKFLLSYVLLISLSSYSVTIDDIDESKLWLTSKYQKHYLALKQAAVLVANTSRCKKLLEATIDIDKTTSMFTFYKVLCRDDNHQTYFEIVDGSNFHILKEEKPVIEKLSICKQRLEEETQLMQGVEWLFDDDIKAQSKTDLNITYDLAFNAQTMQGLTLKYQALCVVSDEGIESFDISGREN